MGKKEKKNSLIIFSKKKCFVFSIRYISNKIMKSNPHFVLEIEINLPLKFTWDGFKKKPIY